MTARARVVKPIARPRSKRASLSVVTLIVLSLTPLSSATGQTLHVAPGPFELTGARSQQQLLVTLDMGSEGAADVTRQATFQSVLPAVALVTAEGLVTPRGDGQTQIVVKHDGREAAVQVSVRGFGVADPVEFRTDVIAALGRAGCNQGACHGSPQGKNGFRLSLRGFMPDLDYATLTHEQGGRRTDALVPEDSLVLLKGSGGVAHQGGIRFRASDPSYRALWSWINEGCRDTGMGRKLVRLEVLPDRRRLHTDYPRQPLVARALFADGTARDVTDLAVFTSSNEARAPVTPAGVVEFNQTAEASILVRYLDKITGARLSYVRHDPSFAWSGPEPANYVDRLVFAKQREMQLLPTHVADDASFLRRVSLDLIGLPPTPDEAREFLDSTDPDRRGKLVERLLARDEFASYWSLKWADLMRGNRATITERGLHSFHRYLVQVFAEDRPLTEFARETLTGLGNTLYHPAASFHRVARTPDEAAEGMAQLFLGVRIGCAKCHNHPFEAISQDDYYGLAAYFARVRFKGSQFGLDDEVVYLDRQGEVNHPTRNQAVSPAAFGEPAGELPPDADRRQRLADWLTRPDNRWFAPSTVNRVWYHLMGRGLVHPVDDFRDTNPPVNPELLAALADEFARGDYRLKPVVRIVNSRAYQLSATPRAQPSADAADESPYFTRAAVRMLAAEQILDAISSATGVPEQFPGYPVGTRAMELAEGGIEHHFLKAFSKPVRDVGCECAREEDPSLGQVLHLLNNPAVVSKLKSTESRLGHWLAERKSTAEIAELMYLATLSRRPTAAELQLVETYLADFSERSEGLFDLQHALINSNEFLLRH